MSVHVFVSAGRFRTDEELESFVRATYTEDGDAVDSPFAAEVGLEQYEPGCIEAVSARTSRPIRSLLERTSYADSWLSGVPQTPMADAAVCVLPPNRLAHPERSSMQYVGAFEFRVR